MQIHDIQNTPVPIAVVGMACRLPGGANTPEKLWQMLADGRDGWTDVPKDRFNWKSFHHPDAETQGGFNHRGGHFLDQDIAAFDGGFFDIPGFEREAIDPQQRIQLEVAYEALENAGIPIERLKGSNTSVYVAVFSQDYAQMQFKDLNDLPQYHMTGIGNAIVSNRISYLFDLRGPSVTVDTGCSGGLVSIHQACETLRSGDCDMALAGGVNLLISPDLMIPMSLMHILNKDGKCFSFDTRGSGYGRGEGAAMVVLKRLDDALRDGDNIRAVIRNTGLNHDGKTTGITLPNRDSQQALIRSVYQRARIDPRDTPYIEAHGTGTAVGDVEEIEAIQSAFEAGREGLITTPLYVGTVKPNIGHLESASGLAGFIKAVLMIEKDMIPPNLNLKTLKNTLKLDGSRVTVPSRLESWPAGTSRRISINSFGYGGTNGHAIVEALTETLSANGLNGNTSLNGNTPTDTPQVLAVTAKNVKSLKDVIKGLRDWAEAQVNDAGVDDEKTLLNLAYTLTARRSTMQWRHSFTATSLKGLVATLSDIDPEPIRSHNNHRIVFIFTGQGAQWFAMGRELMSTQSPYGDSMRKSDEILRSFGASWRLVEELSKDAEQSRVNEAEIAQPATTAIQIALVDLLHSAGVEPYAVLGHSSGEIGAAYAAGAVDQLSALKAAYHRGRLNVKEVVPTKGAMMAVALGDEEATQYTSQLTRGTAVVACSNSPSSTTISGDEDAVEELREILESKGIFARRLKVDTAYHSHHVKAVSNEYLRALDGLESGMTRSSVKFYSSVTGEEKTAGFGPKYWVSNLESKVRFCDALQKLSEDIHAVAQSTLIPLTPVFVELGPHGALGGPVRQTMTSTPLDSGYLSFSALSRNQNALTTVFDLAGKLFERGCRIDLPSVNLIVKPTESRNLLHTLPPYAWDHSTTYWHESRLSKAHRFRPFPQHDLLGVRLVSSSSLQPIWRHVFTVNSLPWLREHTIDGMIIFPAAAYMCMAIEAIRQNVLEKPGAPDITKYTLKDVSFINTLIVPDTAKQPTELQIAFRPADKSGSQWKEFNIVSISPEGATVEHCRGSISVELSTAAGDEASREEKFATAAQIDRLRRLKATCFEEIDCEALYDDLKGKGNYYGPNFARVKELKFGNDVDALGNVVIADVAEIMPAKFQQPHVIHPTTLDALLHAVIPLFARKRAGTSVMAIGIGELNIYSGMTTAPNATLTTVNTLTRAGLRCAAAEISVFQNNDATNDQECIIRITDAELFATGRAQQQETDGGRDISYQMQWGVDSDHLTSPYFRLQDYDVEIVQARRLKLLSQASALHLRNCFESLIGRGITTFAGHFQLLFAWMLRFLRSPDAHALIGHITTPNDVEATLRAAHEQGVEGEMLGRMGPKLPEILLGNIEPLALMMKDDLLYRLYAEEDASKRCYTHMIRYLKHATFKNPNMNVLELGAGTGGATFPLLEALSEGTNGTLPIKRYVFTDVSSGFFEKSRERLMKWDSYFDFKKLDIQGDMLEQGFEEGSYDLIIASNVLHVANYIDVSLERVRRLLKPGGRLLLIELTRIMPFYNACIGVLPGWWGGVDDGRTDAPLITIEQWDAALRRTGFGGLEIAAKDYEGDAQRSAMMVAKAIVEDDTTKDTPVKLLVHQDLEATGGYVLQVKSALSEAGLSVSTESLSSPDIKYSPDILYIILDDGVNPVLKTDSEVLFGNIKNALVHATRVLWVTAQTDESAVMNPEKGLVNGLARVVRGENQALRFLTFDVQESIAGPLSATIAQKIKDIALTGFYGPEAMRSPELEYIFKDGQLRVPRLVPDAKMNQCVRASGGEQRIEMQPFHQPGRPLRLQVPPSGFLEDMQFVDDLEVSGPLADDELEVQVEACGINFKDVIIALGQVKKPLPMAGEYAGIVVRVPPALEGQFRVGDRVCGYGFAAYASRIKVPALVAARIPDDMSSTTAAAVAVAFSTAHLALIDIARLEKGQTVLIHAAAGGVGQAALRIAKHVGAEIFATVGSDAKRQLLAEEYGIPDDHVFSSSTGVFRKGIHRLTNGKGVDVVLNSLSGQLLQDSWAAIASFGTFVEIGKTDLHAKSAINLAPFDRHVTFASVDLGLMCLERPQQVSKLLSDVFAKFATGAYTPMNPITVMPITEIEDAFRLVQARKHVGKLVLEATPTTMVKVLSKPSAGDELALRGDATYVIAGGLGGLGRGVARFLVSRGAKHVALLSRRGLQGEELQKLEAEFAQLGAQVAVFACDLSDASKVDEMVTTCALTMPPIRGVIQTSMVLQDRVMAQMTLDDFQIALRPKVDGTKNLAKALRDQTLDFFVMFSSDASIIGNLSQANYAAGNAFMDALANSTAGNNNTPFIALNLGGVLDAGAIATSEHIQKILVRQGYHLIKEKELLAMIEYSISEQARASGCRQFIIGFDYRSMRDSDNSYSLKNPMFSHLLLSKDNQETKAQDGTAAQSIEDAISVAETIEQVVTIVAEAIARKISTLVAVAYEEVDLQRSVVEFGLDSLVLIELKNWIAQKFQATLQASEISDAKHIIALAMTVAGRSALVAKSLGEEKEAKTNGVKEIPKVDGTKTPVPATSTQQKQPLPALDDTLNEYLETVRPLLTDNEHAELRSHVEDFRQGAGRQLQTRLEKLATDPNVDNWQVDLYTRNTFLRDRTPLIPRWNFYLSHLMSAVPHSPAQRAAIISAAALQFKMDLEAGKLSQDGAATKRYSWFFNATREPGRGEDKMVKHASSNYVVAFRRGHAYKIPLRQGGQPASYAVLKATFQAILDGESKPESWVGVLTADDRDSWTDVRQLLGGASPANSTWIKAIEAAAFVVYLDEAQPQTANDRAHQFLHNNGFNRWADKTIQFAVCGNGISATIAEHAMIDGGVLKVLNDFITNAILSHQQGEVDADALPIEEYTFNTNPILDQHIARVRTQLDATVSRYEPANFDLTNVGKDYFRGFKCPAKSGVQMAIQLAVRQHFGTNPAAFEPVSLDHFNGRVERAHVVVPEVVAFCAAAADKSASTPAKTAELRRLFFDGVKAHANSVMRTSRGHGIDRHLLCLEWSVRDGEEEVPALFASEVYKKTRPRMVATDCWTSGALECGSVQPDEGSVWMHFELEDDRVRFAVWGPAGQTEGFKALLEESVEDVRAILEG